MEENRNSLEMFEIQDFTPYLLNLASESASLGFSNIYKDLYNMKRTEWRVLFHLGRYGTMTATEIGERSKLHKTKISRAVSALEKKRFLSRETSENDRRVEILNLRKPGMEAYHALTARAEAYERALERKLGARDAAALKRALKKLLNDKRSA